VTIDESLIRDVFLRVTAEDLDQVLTTIEGYRVCVSTLHNLRGPRHPRHQRQMVTKCARSCERALVEYVATGCFRNALPARVTTDFQKAHLVFLFEW
jgi:hypothetical protein